MNVKTSFLILSAFFVSNHVFAKSSEKISCDEGHAYLGYFSMGDGCCVAGTNSSIDTCIKNGKWIFYDQYNSNDPRTKRYEVSFLNNKMNGKFIEWGVDGQERRAVGEYKDGKPEGKWLVKNYGDTKQYEVLFKKNYLKSVKLPDGKVVEIFPLKYSKTNSPGRVVGVARMLGVVKQLDVPAEGYARHYPAFVHEFFYADKEKKFPVGGWIAGYSFGPTSAAVSSTYFESEEPKYEVYKHDGDMCYLGDQWVDCKGRFEDVVENLKDHALQINRNEKLFDSPGGKEISLKMEECSSTLHFYSKTMSVEIVEKKLLKDELWIGLHVDVSCDPESGRGFPAEVYWTPLYKGDQIKIDTAPAC